MNEVETEQVEFGALVVGDVIFSHDQQRQGTITELHHEFSQVTLDDGSSPVLNSPVTIRKRT